MTKTMYPTGRSHYRPGHDRVGEPTPQRAPYLFSSEDIRAEVKYLMRMNRRLGSNTLRTIAYHKLIRELEGRKS